MSEGLLELETAICGTLLRDAHCIGEVAAALKPEDFTNAVTRSIFNAICALHFRGSAVDRLSVQQELGADYADYLKETERRVAPSLPDYCRMLKDGARLEKLREAALGLSYAQTVEDAEAGIDRINRLSGDRGSSRIISMADALNGFFDRIKQKPEYLHWGMEALDKALYIERGDFVVIGGYPSAGKTLLSIQFALGLAETYRVGYFSLETSERKLTDRVMCHASGVPLSKIKSRDFTAADTLAMTTAAERLFKLPVDWIPAAGMTPRDIRATALSKRHEVIFVDYLQIVRSAKRDRYEMVTEVSQQLARIAKENNIAVIALAQLSRPEKIKGRPQPPTLASFRESGQIEQDADSAIVLYPEDPNDNRSDRILRVLKNKEGVWAELKLAFDGAAQTMAPRPPTRGESYRNLMHELGELKKQERLERQVKLEEITDKDDEPLPF